MQAALSKSVLACVAVMAAQLFQVVTWAWSPPAGLMCGNVITAPYTITARVVAPAGVLGAAFLARGCVSEGRWPSLGILALGGLVVALAGFVSETWFLRSRAGLPLPGLWWLPWL